jgi:hypothetical protein
MEGEVMAEMGTGEEEGEIEVEVTEEEGMEGEVLGEGWLQEIGELFSYLEGLPVSLPGGLRLLGP